MGTKCIAQSHMQMQDKHQHLQMAVWRLGLKDDAPFIVGRRTMWLVFFWEIVGNQTVGDDRFQPTRSQLYNTLARVDEHSSSICRQTVFLTSLTRVIQRQNARCATESISCCQHWSLWGNVKKCKTTPKARCRTSFLARLFHHVSPRDLTFRLCYALQSIGTHSRGEANMHTEVCRKRCVCSCLCVFFNSFCFVYSFSFVHCVSCSFLNCSQEQVVWFDRDQWPMRRNFGSSFCDLFTFHATCFTRMLSAPSRPCF